MTFSIMRMTTPGKDIWAAAQAGMGMELTRVAVGSGILPTGGSMINRSALISEEMSLPISDVIIGSASASALVEVLLSNAALDAGFYFREVGIFARHPTTGTEVLYLYDNSSPDQEWIPDKLGLPVREYFRFQLAAAEASAITFDSSGAPGELTIDDIQDEYASPGKLWSSTKISAALDTLAGAGRTAETVMGAYTAAENRIGPSVTTPGNPVTASTKATDIAVVNLKGAMQITKPNPEADTSPDNIAAITGIVNPTITATSGGQSNSQQISGELYRLPDGTKDEYDGQAGTLTKRVGKLVLTGTETMRLQENRVIITISPIRVISASNKGYCTHFAVTNGDAYLNTQIGQISWQVQGNITIGNFGTWADADAVKAYLSAQAAASTPVTLYYELAAPQTTEIRHDLACYADSTTFACADPLATDMSVTVLDGRMVGRSRDAELLAGLHPSVYRQSNRNLLDNGDFRAGSVVNQRGVSGAISTNSYTLDRWSFYFPAADGSITIKENSVQMNAEGRADLYQNHGNGVLPPGIYTASLLKADGSLLTATVRWTGTNNPTAYFEPGFFFSLANNAGPVSPTNTTVIFDSHSGHTIDIAAVKLELGPVSTLALDPPADYGETLRKCQRYLLMGELLSAQIYAITTNEIHFLVPIAVPMREIPTLVLSQTAPQTILVRKASGEVSGFEFSVYNAVVNALHIVCTKTAHGLTPDSGLALIVRAGSGFSAEP